MRCVHGAACTDSLSAFFPPCVWRFRAASDSVLIMRSAQNRHFFRGKTRRAEKTQSTLQQVSAIRIIYKRSYNLILDRDTIFWKTIAVQFTPEGCICLVLSADSICGASYFPPLNDAAKIVTKDFLRFLVNQAFSEPEKTGYFLRVTHHFTDSSYAPCKPCSRCPVNGRTMWSC